jgi:bifunctional UDP-N-acetylglucosamine pyrophosphorylase / glucosamine-1-phosphate N-acetyltransferase
MREVTFAEAQAAKLDAMLARRDRGLLLEDPSRVDVRGTLEFGANVSVEVNVIFKGHVVLGDDVRIGANCIIEDATIEAGAAIKEFTTVTSAHVGSGSEVGPYARIRPKSRIGAACQIGNFVEIKETTMGTGCKINHHSFVGNAILGDGVIIGAGSITCNHDGTGVNSTTIEDGAYVGSGVMLIAPMIVGAHSMVAAGSTITENVPPDVLAICRTRDVVFKPLNRSKG